MKNSKLLALSINDTRQIFRDRVLTALWILPGLVLLFVALGLPPLSQQFPFVATYYQALIAVLCATNATFPAFVVSFIFLDEKDEGVLSALQVVPVPAHTFVLYRMGFITLLSSSIVMLTLLVADLALPFMQIVSLAVVFALSAPLPASL